jgi:chemotaxis protein histidine kinase CheA
MPNASVTANWLTAAPWILVAVIAIIGVFYFGWMKSLKITICVTEDQNKALKAYNDELVASAERARKQADADNKTRDQRICSLEGQVLVLKTVPLQEIATTMKEILKQLLDSEATLVRNTAVVTADRADVKDTLASHDESVR